MPALRYTNPPKQISPKPRKSIDPSTHHIIDTTLKAARVCSQHASPLISTYLQHELRLLERIYYKGANQHRAALFWRRVQEVRRLGKRVMETRLLCLLDDFRYSFYTASVGTEGGAERNPKILRGAWTQVPNERFLNYFHDRLSDFTELLTSAKERLIKAFHTLSLTMQTGAFLQLTLILAAIVSRLHAVMDELDTILRPFLTTLYTLLGEEALGFKRRVRSRAPEALKKASSAAKKETLRRTGRTTDSENAMDEILLGEGEDREDLGATVLRKTPAYFRAKRQDGDDKPLRVVSTTEEEESPELPDPYASSSVIITTPITTHTSTPASAEEGTASRTEGSGPRPGPAQEIGMHDAGLKSKRKTAKEMEVNKKKKKRRRDEIDEIFGSL